VLDLKPVILEAVRETLLQHQAIAAQLPTERLAFPEPEAAALLGIPRHSLRDCRLRGEVQGRLVGKRILYDRRELLRFLSAK
jgi:hypothetical protein